MWQSNWIEQEWLISNILAYIAFLLRVIDPFFFFFTSNRTVGKVATQEEDDVILDNKATTEEKEPLKRPCWNQEIQINLCSESSLSTRKAIDCATNMGAMDWKLLRRIKIVLPSLSLSCLLCPFSLYNSAVWQA